MKHELKIWPRYYARVADGTKTFEVRSNDRLFQSGDVVVLNEYDPNISSYTESKKLEFRIGFVLQLDGDRVVFSLLPIYGGPG